MFTPSRLRVARKRRGLTKTRFAQLIGVELRTVTGYERGEYEPGLEVLARISRVLSFPAEFFAQPDLHEPSPATASFRGMARMAAANREAALASGALAFVLNDYIEACFRLPIAEIADLRGEDPELAAMTLRQQWGIGEQPIRNAVHLLESKGIRVFSMAEDTVEVDAFSLWRENTPFIFLNTMKSAERSRFDAAHELGHLVLHRHVGPQGREAEHEADQFASAFLMPQGSILASAPILPNLERLIRLKQHWIVSVAALAYRLHALNLLTDWHYRSLCIDIAERGYRSSEPSGAPREMSQILAKVLAALREDGVNQDDIAESLHIGVDELNKLVFGLVLQSLPGGGNTLPSSRRAFTPRLVK